MEPCNTWVYDSQQDKYNVIPKDPPSVGDVTHLSVVWILCLSSCVAHLALEDGALEVLVEVVLHTPEAALHTISHKISRFSLPITYDDYIRLRVDKNESRQANTVQEQSRKQRSY